MYHKPGQIVETKFRLKVPHSTAMSASLDFYPIDSLFRVCALKVTHIGRNYPCLVDPSSGPNTGGTVLWSYKTMFIYLYFRAK